MAVISPRATVGTTAVRLDTASTDLTWSLTMCNRGAASVFLGGASVTASSGYELAAGESLSIDLRPADGGLYAITASGTVRVDRLQTAWS